MPAAELAVLDEELPVAVAVLDPDLVLVADPVALALPAEELWGSPLTEAAAVYAKVSSIQPVSRTGKAYVDGSLMLEGIYPSARPLRYDQASMSYSVCPAMRCQCRVRAAYLSLIDLQDQKYQPMEG